MIPLSTKGQAVATGLISIKEANEIEDYINQRKNEILQEATKQYNIEIYKILRSEHVGKEKADRIINKLNNIEV